MTDWQLLYDGRTADGARLKGGGELEVVVNSEEFAPWKLSFPQQVCLTCGQCSDTTDVASVVIWAMTILATVFSISSIPWLRNDRID